ncbi:unnamed protein product [Prunus armeniaca]
MWDFVQVAVVVTRVLEIRGKGVVALVLVVLRLDMLGSVGVVEHSLVPQVSKLEVVLTLERLRQREDWVSPLLASADLARYGYGSLGMVPAVRQACELGFLEWVGPRPVVIYVEVRVQPFFGRASFAGGVISFCSLVANWDPSKILFQEVTKDLRSKIYEHSRSCFTALAIRQGGLAWVAWCRVCLSFGKIPLGRRLGSARGVGSDSTSVEWVWRKPHDLRTGLGPPYWLGSGYTFPKNSWVALEPCLVEASVLRSHFSSKQPFLFGKGGLESALLGAGPSIEKDFGKENWSWARDSCRSAGTGVSCLWQGLGSAKFSFGASVNGFFSKWVLGLRKLGALIRFLSPVCVLLNLRQVG